MKDVENFIKSHPKGHFMQSEMWGNVKADWKQEVITVNDERKIKGAVRVLIRKLPFYLLL